MIHPTNAIIHAGHAGRGLAKGGESCWGGQWLITLWRGHKVSIASSRWGINGCAGQVLEVKPTLGAIFGHAVARATHVNVRLRR